MSDAWNDMKKAKENEYFERKNREALERLKKNEQANQVRLIPVTGEPMEQLALHGVVIDRCKTSGGIWLDAGELEQIVEAAKTSESAENWITGFFRGLSGK